VADAMLANAAFTQLRNYGAGTDLIDVAEGTTAKGRKTQTKNGTHVAIASRPKNSLVAWWLKTIRFGGL